MKKAIVIGATSGIGKELAKLLADNGYKVGITGRRTELLEELQSVSSNFHIKTLDVTETTILGCICGENFETNFSNRFPVASRGIEPLSKV